MAGNVDTDKYYVEKEEITLDSDDEFVYEEVPVEDDSVPPELEEDLDAAVRTIREANEDANARVTRDHHTKPAVVKKPEVVDDFVRNFLIRMGLNRTLDCFQTEWYELQERGLLGYTDIGTVPDVYTRNQELEDEIDFIKKETIKFRNAALKAKETYVKLRKERDFHRMHHKRIVQEKNKLIDDIKRLKRHYSGYAPNMEALRSRYEAAMKEKMLANLERDRAVSQVNGLQSTIKGMEGLSGSSEEKPAKGPTHRQLILERQKKNQGDGDVKNLPDNFKRYPNDSEFPVDTGVNPYLNQVKAPPGHVTRTGGFRLSNTFTAHSHPISGVALHPRKQILATCSDDHTWKMWAVPSGDIIMTGEGHSDWVSDCDFHPAGSSLATTSGDSTVKIWDFSKAACVHTFTDHTAAVWSCSWHTCGDFLATSSMDNTAKVWDINRCVPRSACLCLCLCLYVSVCVCVCVCVCSVLPVCVYVCLYVSQYVYREMYFSTLFLQGDTIASCDSYGVVKLWDVRSVAPMASFEVGPHPANKLAFDPSGGVLAIASNDSIIKMYEINSGMVQALVGHEDAVQCLCFDRTGEFMVSGGSDSTVRIWS
ncbi:hypothetical protein EGW08_005721 [Elysia chlorotica]|uniref:Uncharacterized protein n=1 Tax=Elysia chlorotica TaxID=188477 RepID=A0A433TY72_ELYCH|nr:hypothetical protein EGW08_005721 [Elysia chlorotica]